MSSLGARGVYDTVEVWHVAATLTFSWCVRQVMRASWRFTLAHGALAAARAALTHAAYLSGIEASRLLHRAIEHGHYFIVRERRRRRQCLVFLLVDYLAVVNAAKYATLAVAVRRHFNL